MQDIRAASRDTKVHGHPGTSNPSARLNDESVIMARRLYRPRCRQWGVRALARRFGVSYTTMQQAISGTCWRHIQR
jgi:hypothetical protein